MNYEVVKGDLIIIPFSLSVGDEEEEWIPDPYTHVVLSISDSRHSDNPVYQQETNNSKGIIIVPTEFTSTVNISKTYYYDVSVQYGDGQRETPIRGTIRFLPTYHAIAESKSNEETGGQETQEGDSTNG